MMKNFFRVLLVAGLAALNLPVSAEDIDLFIQTDSTASAPNVMLVLDNGANFSSSVTSLRCSITPGGVVTTDGTGTAPTNLDKTAAAVEQCALYSALQALSANTVKFNIGVMAFNANGLKQFNAATNSFSSGCDAGGTGGCLLMPLVPFNATNRANILEWIRNWAISGNSNYVVKGNNTANGAAMQETWAYYYGKTGVSGRDYSSIVPPSNCANKYVIFVGNAYRNNSTPGDGTNEASSPFKPLDGTSVIVSKRASPAATQLQKAVINDTIKTVCSSTATVLQTAEGKGVYALNWANYMRAQGVTTYSIGVLGPTCNAEYAAHLTKLGAPNIGGGKFFGATDFTTLETAIQTALGEIQSIASVFAAVSLPVSVNTQGTYLNQVFVGMFRPDKKALPRWNGNLKEYKLGKLNGTLQLLDADDTAAISGSGSGFIAECARSFWTPTTPDAYWAFRPQGSCPPPTSAASDYYLNSNVPDGNIVEKGAQGYTLRGSNAPMTAPARTVKTCDPTSCAALIDFNTTNVTPPMLLGAGSTDTTQRDALVNWQRGLNVDGEDLTTYAIRPSVHGDVVHSRPVAINYGTDTAPQVVVFYGGNDGMLRAVNGNRTDPIGTFAAGSELWSFVAPEFYPKIKRLRDNTTQVSFYGNTTGSPTPQPKPYGFDGAVTADASNKWIYATMRRGGRAVYAFDVSTPTSPKFKWTGTGKVGCPNLGDDTGCTSNFSGIGQTWSAPKSMNAAGYSSGPVLIMGGGYDTCEDSDPNTCTSSSKGNKVYVLDAASGALINTLNTDRGVVADVFVVPDPNNPGSAAFAYAVDLGGNVYRIGSGTNASNPFGTTAPANWTIRKIASFGCGTIGGCYGTANRKFMFMPDVVLDNGKYVLLLGSGDREKPLAAYTYAASVSNYFFMLKDDPSDPTWLTSESTNCGGSAVICLNSLVAVSGTNSPTLATVAAKKGWYLALSPTEQVVTSAITIFGVVTFSTHTPHVETAGECSSDLGVAKVYSMTYANAGVLPGNDSLFEVVKGGGLSPSPVGGMVTLDSGEQVPFCIGCSSQSPLQGGNPPPPPGLSQPKSRVYWQIEQ